MNIKGLFVVCIMCLSIESTSHAMCSQPAAISAAVVGCASWVGGIIITVIVHHMRENRKEEMQPLINTSDQIKAHYDRVDATFEKPVCRACIATTMGMICGALGMGYFVVCRFVDYN